MWLIPVQILLGSQIKFPHIPPNLRVSHCPHCTYPLVYPLSESLNLNDLRESTQIIWHVGRKTPEAYFNQVFFTLFVFSKHVCNGLISML